jgi:hypothetical protein
MRPPFSCVFLALGLLMGWAIPTGATCGTGLENAARWSSADTWYTDCNCDDHGSGCPLPGPPFYICIVVHCTKTPSCAPFFPIGGAYTYCGVSQHVGTSNCPCT